MLYLSRLFILLLLVTQTFGLDSKKQVLYHLNQKIVRVKKDLYDYELEQKQVHSYLEKNKKKSVLLKKELSHIQKDLINTEIYLKNLGLQQKHYQGILQTSHIDLGQYYTIATNVEHPLLLTQETHMTSIRMLYYAESLYALQAGEIANTTNLVKKMHEIEIMIRQKQRNIKNLHHIQTEKEKKIVILKQHESNLLEVLDKRIDKKKQDLTGLITNRRAIENTIQKIIQKKNTPAPAAEKKILENKENTASFLRPVHGIADYLFGRHIQQSQLTWQGMLFYAPAGSSVHAALAGKVVFSQWLKGYGLLLILQHTNGYLSLYGRNAVLYKNLGDVVKKGETIATVGKTGGYEKSALYFGIWHAGKAVDPKPYLAN